MKPLFQDVRVDAGLPKIARELRGCFSIVPFGKTLGHSPDLIKEAFGIPLRHGFALPPTDVSVS